MSVTKAFDNAQKPFIFDDELCVYDEKYETVDGYLWATDVLVYRLAAQLKDTMSPSEIESMENINFYADLHIPSGKISMQSHFWYHKDSPEGETEATGTAQIPLDESDGKALRELMEAYCNKLYKVSCLDFLNYIRSGENLPPLKAPVFSTDKKEVRCKPSLLSRIQAAAKKSEARKDLDGRSAGAPER